MAVRSGTTAYGKTTPLSGRSGFRQSTRSGRRTRRGAGWPCRRPARRGWVASHGAGRRITMDAGGDGKAPGAGFRRVGMDQPGSPGGGARRRWVVRSRHRRPTCRPTAQRHGPLRRPRGLRTTLRARLRTTLRLDVHEQRGVYRVRSADRGTCRARSAARWPRGCVHHSTHGAARWCSLATSGRGHVDAGRQHRGCTTAESRCDPYCPATSGCDAYSRESTSTAPDAISRSSPGPTSCVGGTNGGSLAPAARSRRADAFAAQPRRLGLATAERRYAPTAGQVARGRSLYPGRWTPRGTWAESAQTPRAQPTMSAERASPSTPRRTSGGLVLGRGPTRSGAGVAGTLGNDLFRSTRTGVAAGSFGRHKD